MNRSSSQLLALLQLSDSFFPTGMFAHSLGLEGLARRGRVRSASDVEELLLGALTHTVIPSDCVALLNAHRALRSGAIDELVEIDRRLFLMKAAPELRQASQQHGRRLLSETETFGDTAMLDDYGEQVRRRTAPGCGAVALGAVSAALEIDAGHALAGYVHGFMTGVVSAAIRLVSVSNTECQQVIRRVQMAITQDLEHIHDRPWQAMMAFSPELDIASMGHVHDDLRMFAS